MCVEYSTVQSVFLHYVQRAASGHSKGFGKCFLRFPQAVGLYCTASKQGDLSENILHSVHSLELCSTVPYMQKCERIAGRFCKMFSEISTGCWAVLQARGTFRKHFT